MSGAGNRIVGVEYVAIDNTGAGYKSALDRANNFANSLSQSTGKAFNEAGNQARIFSQVASGGFEQSALSAKQLTFAARQLPMQFTDIVVSLQGGQSALQVLLQQGGQIKDMYGGIGNALKGVAGYMVNLAKYLLNPWALATAAVVGFGTAIISSMNALDDMNKALILSNNNGKFNADTLNAISREAGALSGSYGNAKEAVLAMVKTGVINQTDLENSTKGISVATQLLGDDVSKVSEKFAKIRENPLQATLDLDKEVNVLSVSIINQIAHLERMGDKAGATSLALKEITKGLIDKKSQVDGVLTGWGTLVQDLSRYFSEWGANASYNISTIFGMFPTHVNQLKQAQIELQKLKVDRSNIKNNFDALFMGYDGISGLDAQIADTERQVKTAMTLSKEYQNQANQQAKIKSAMLSVVNIGATELEQRKAIAKEFENLAIATQSGGLDEATMLGKRDILVKRLEGLDKNPSAKIGGRTEKVDQIAKEIAEQEALNKMLLQGIDIEKASMIARLESQGAMPKQAEQIYNLTQSNKALADAKQLAIQASEQQILTNAKNYDSLREAVEKEEEQLANYGKLPSEIAKGTIAMMEQNLVQAKTLGLSTEMLERDIALWQRRAEAMAGVEARKQAEETAKKVADANKKMADEAQREYERLSDNISRSISDGLMRGFENGKSFAENFKDTLKNMFATLVLQPAIKMVLDGSGVTGIMSQISRSFSGTQGAQGESTQSSSGIIDTLTKVSKGFDGLNSGFESSIAGFGDTLSDIFGSSSQVQVGALQGASASGGVGGFISSNASQISNALGYAGAAYAGYNMIKEDNYAGAILTGIGAYFGGPAGAAIGAYFGGMLAKVKTQKSSAGATGSYVDGKFTGNGLTGLAGYGKNAGGQDALTSGLEAYSKTFGALLKSFGLNSDITTSASVFQRNSKKQRGWGYFDASFDGGNVNFATGRAGSASNAINSIIEWIMSTGMVESIQKSKLPEGLKLLFDGLTDKEQIQTMVTNALKLGEASELIAKSLDITVDEFGFMSREANLSVESISKLTDILIATSQDALTFGDAMLNIKGNIVEMIGVALPNSLKEYDQRLKEINTTTAEGRAEFLATLNARSAFKEYDNMLVGLQNNVQSGLYEMVSDSEKYAMMQADLAKRFTDLGLAVPKSTQELINMGKTIDYTTASGLNLANQFPSLVSLFNELTDATKNLKQALNPQDFVTFADYLIALSNPSGFSNYVSNSSIAGISTGSNTTSTTQVAQNTGDMVTLINTLITEIIALKDEAKGTKEASSRTFTLLEDVTDGDLSIKTRT